MLIFWEWHWWQTLSYLRDGLIGQQEIDGGWFPPAGLQPPIRPPWMTNPGTIHDWERNSARDYFSRFEQKFYLSQEVPAERHLWEALKRARTARQVRRILANRAGEAD